MDLIDANTQRLKLKREAETSVQDAQSFLATSTSRKRLTVAGVVSLFTEMLSNRARRRRLMEYKDNKAQLVLDTMQAVRIFERSVLRFSQRNASL